MNLEKIKQLKLKVIKLYSNKSLNEREDNNDKIDKYTQKIYGLKDKLKNSCNIYYANDFFGNCQQFYL